MQILTDETQYSGDMIIRRADSSDANDITDMVNSAYRGDTSRAGWTTETDLLEGPRTFPEEIRELIADANTAILLGFAGAELIASINVQNQGDAAYLGMIVTRPVFQGRGIGKQMIAAAEEFAINTWGLKKTKMTVITLREELIRFYERRGYRRTGNVIPFPTNLPVGRPLVEGLAMEYLEKELN